MIQYKLVINYIGIVITVLATIGSYFILSFLLDKTKISEKNKKSIAIGTAIIIFVIFYFMGFVIYEQTCSEYATVRGATGVASNVGYMCNKVLPKDLPISVGYFQIFQISLFFLVIGFLFIFAKNFSSKFNYVLQEILIISSAIFIFTLYQGFKNVFFFKLFFVPIIGFLSPLFNIKSIKKYQKYYAVVLIILGIIAPVIFLVIRDIYFNSLIPYLPNL